jgi:hypothetical protein
MTKSGLFQKSELLISLKNFGLHGNTVLKTTEMNIKTGKDTITSSIEPMLYRKNEVSKPIMAKLKNKG